jgi:ribosomal protein S18 acetylase RimI-like enzyme
MLGRKVYRITLDDDFVMDGPYDEGLGEYGNFCGLLHEHVFAYCKVGSSALSHVAFLERHDFHLIDTNITFTKRVSPICIEPADFEIRFATPADEPQTVDLAERSFSYSRFHLDTSFSIQSANAIKGEWVRNYFRGERGDSMVIASIEGKIVAFLQLFYEKDQALVIDLIAVDRGHRGKGIGKSIISYAETYCRGFKKVKVGTQLANLASLSFYENMGFRIISSQYVFHYHNPSLRQKR